MNTCKTCKWWRKMLLQKEGNKWHRQHENGECLSENIAQYYACGTLSDYDYLGDNWMCVEPDDPYISVYIHTGPDFGCVLWEPGELAETE